MISIFLNGGRLRRNALLRNRSVLIITIVVIFIVTLSIVYYNAHQGPRHHPRSMTKSSVTATESLLSATSTKGSNYSLAVSILQNILREGKSLYPNLTRRDPEFNVTLLNETTLYFNHSLYKYVI